PPASVHVLPVVVELEWDRVILLAQELHRALEHILRRARDTHGIPLDLRLQLRELVAHQPGNRLRQLLVDPLTELRRLADRPLRGRLDLAEVEDLGREATSGRALNQDVAHRLQGELGVAGQRHAVLFERDRAARVLQIEARADLARDLIDGVDKLLVIDLRDDVVAAVRSHRHPREGVRRQESGGDCDVLRLSTRARGALPLALSPLSWARDSLARCSYNY